MIDPKLPLIDLHHHLDGSVRLETILDVGLKHNLPLPAKTLEGLRPYVQVSTPQPGIMAFIERFEWMTGILVDYETCRRVAFENVQDQALEGVDYVEYRYSPWFMAEAHGLIADGVVEAVTDGLRTAEREFGVRANQIGILSRHYGPEIAWKELDALLSCRDEITALDLAGDAAWDFYGGGATATDLNWDRDNSRGDSMEHQFVDNGTGPMYPTPSDLGSYATSGPAFGRGWRGAYLSPPIGPDPWGHRYLVNSVFLSVARDARPGTGPGERSGGWSNDTFCISAGPNGRFETAFGGNAFRGTERRGDDLVFIISGDTR